MSTTYLYSEQTQAQDELFKAHAAFLCEVRNAPRTCKSHFGPYADLGTCLDVVRPLLGKHGMYHSFEKILEIPGGYFSDFAD